MEKEVKIIYSFWETIFCFFFISLGWGTFIIVMIISVKQGLKAKDYIGGGVLFIMYLSLNVIFIFGVLKHTMTKIKLDAKGITVRKPFSNEKYLAWDNIGLISEGFVPSYLYGPTKGYTIKIKSDNSEKEIYLIRSKKVSIFLDKIRSKYKIC